MPAGFLDAPRFPWLEQKEEGGNSFLTGMQLGVHIAQQRANNRRQEILLNSQLRTLQLHEQQFQQSVMAKEQISRGYTELSGVLGTIAEQNAWTSPEAEAAVLRVGSRFPQLATHPSFKGVLGRFEEARKLKADADKLAGQKPAAVRNAEFVTRFESEASQLEASGDLEGAAKLRQQAELVKQSIQSGNESTTINYDEQGRPVVTVTKGALGRAGAGGVTSGTQSKIEQDLINTRKSMDMISDLSQTLSWKDVGAAGVFGENVLDKALPQIGIKSFDPKRTDNRTKLKMLTQGLLRQISPDNRFTNEDRERVEAIAPSTGVFENEAHAKQVLSVMQRVFAKRNIRDMQALGKPISLETLNDAEIGAAVEMGLIPFDAAKEFLTKKFGGQ